MNYLKTRRRLQTVVPIEHGPVDTVSGIPVALASDSCFSDSNQRQFYRRWSRMMSDSAWSDLENSPPC